MGVANDYDHRVGPGTRTRDPLSDVVAGGSSSSLRSSSRDTAGIELKSLVAEWTASLTQGTMSYRDMSWMTMSYDRIFLMHLSNSFF